jgi:Mycolic acid cyclopropane synthetase
MEQKILAEERIKEAGLEGVVRVHLLDYRELPLEFEKAFDAFVSIEMIEVSTQPSSWMRLTITFPSDFISTSAPNTIISISSLWIGRSSQKALLLS